MNQKVVIRVMKVDIPLKIKLSFVAFDEYSRCEVSDTGSKNRLDLTLKVIRCVF